MDELTYKPAHLLARAIRRKEVSSEEVVRAFLARIDSVNPKLNAIVNCNPAEAISQARQADRTLATSGPQGSLHGVPITVKDTLDTVGLACSAGTKGKSGFLPAKDATVVARLKSAGAIILGKTNVPDLALTFETDNYLYGRTNNPYNLARTPGGSSGGEAAIITSCGSPLGLGSDVAGSIRHPAHCCGITGLKPTSGRVPRTGHFPPPGGPSDALWQIGPLARFVKDLCLALPLLAGPDWQDANVVPMPTSDPDAIDLKTLRVAFYTDNGILPPTPDIVRTVLRTARFLSDECLVVTPDRPPQLERAYDLQLAIVGADGGLGIQMLLQAAGTYEPHPLLLQIIRLMQPRAVPTPEYFGVLLQWDCFRSAMLAFFENYDVILCPVAAYPAQQHGALLEKDDLREFSYTMTYNLTGWPAVAIRAGTSDEGLPIGVQVVARPWCEAVALAVAQCIESGLGGWAAPPC